MVHSKLISEGRVQPLTFKELRKLERMDAKKEREAKLFEVAKEGVSAAGAALEGALSNQITGPLLVIGALLGTEEGLHFLDSASAGAQKLAAEIANAIRTGAFPQIVTPIPNPSSTGQFCVRAEGLFGAPVKQCFNTAADREAWISIGLRLKRIANPQRFEIP